LFINTIFAYYISNFNIKINNNIRDTAANLLDLNYVLNKKTPSNNLKSFEYDNYGKKSLCYTYETLSNFDDYTYKNKVLFIDPCHYLATYNFNYDNYSYRYLLYINATKISNSLTSWDVKLKHNYRFADTIQLNEDMIKKWVSRCINKKTIISEQKLINFFK
jgi:hypothetical protein